MNRKLTFSLQTLIIGVLFTALSVEFGVNAWVTYSRLKATILAGFDKKLDAISTASGLFVDGDEHESIFNPRHIAAVAVDEKRSQVLGVDNSSGVLVTIDKDTGGALDRVKLNWLPLPARAVTNLAYDSANDVLYALGEDGKGVFTISQESGKVRPAVALPQKATAIAYRSSDDSLLAVGERLMRIDSKKRRVEQSFSMPELITGAAWVPALKRLLLLRGSTGKMLALEEGQSEAREIGNITTLEEPAEAPEDAPGEASAAPESDSGESTPDQWKEPEVVVLPAGGLAYDPDSARLFTTTDRLVKVSPETGMGNPYGLKMGFRNEMSPIYRKYAARMKRVMDAAGLTYHYTVVLPKENQLIYVIDATDGEDHSVLGTQEEVEPEEWARLNAVSTTGVASQSKVKHFDLWGLLKVGTAAIRNSAGEIVGLVGADVNISIIDKKTRIALIRVLGLAVLGLLVAGAAAVWIARDLGAPMRKLKEGILRVAAGDYGERIEIESPRELSKLAQVFDETRMQLQKTVGELERENQAFERNRRSHILADLFTRDVDDFPSAKIEGPESYILAARVGELEGRNDLSGYVRKGERGVLWIGDTTMSPLQTARRKSDIALICGRLLTRYAENFERVPEELQGLLPEHVSLYVVFDLAAGSVVTVTQNSVSSPLALVHRGTGLQPFDLGQNEKVDLAPGESIFLSTIQDSERTTEYVEQLSNLWDAAPEAVMFGGDGSDADLKVLIHRSSEQGGGNGTV
ncbi:MAG: HAMP domain-containing protein [Bdellovibrionota bacterium]